MSNKTTIAYFEKELKNHSNKLEQPCNTENINEASKEAYTEYLDFMAQGNNESISKMIGVSKGLDALISSIIK